MNNLDYIKTFLIKRVREYKDKYINPIDIQIAEDERKILDVIFDRKNCEIHSILSNGTVDADILEELFGIETLNHNNIYTSGDNVVYGGYRFIVLGNAKIHASYNAEVCAFQNAYVSIRQKATVFPFDNVTFEAYNNTKVIIEKGYNISGNMHDISIAKVYDNYGNINVFDECDVTIFNSNNVIFHDRSRGHIHGASVGFSYEESVIDVNDKSILYAYNKTKICAHHFSNVYVTGDCHCDLYDNSRGYIESSTYVHAYDNTMAELRGQRICDVELFNNSCARIYNTCIHVRLHDNTVLQDFTDTYLNPFDYAIIIWMNKHKVWFAQQGDEDTCIIYDKEDECNVR